jgi:hypothetical protein
MQLLISLHQGANQTCKTVAILAAKINSGAIHATLPDLAGVFRSEALQYPALHEEYKVNEGENILTVTIETSGRIKPALEIKIIQP